MILFLKKSKNWDRLKDQEVFIQHTKNNKFESWKENQYWRGKAKAMH